MLSVLGSNARRRTENLRRAEVRPPVERDQLAIDRLSRIWAIVEYIAENPGTNRRKLAEQYALSERQVQEDLRVIREELDFPWSGERDTGSRARTRSPSTSPSPKPGR